MYGYYVLVKKSTGLIWAIGRNKISNVPNHSIQKFCKEWPLHYADHSECVEVEDWTNQARQTIKGSNASKLHIMNAQK